LSLHRSQGSASSRPWRVLRCAIAACVGLALLAPASGDAAYGLIGKRAPDFTLHAVAGGNVRLSEHRGEVVVISFWSSRCASCRGQLAALDRSLVTYSKAGLQMYGINVDDDAERAVDAARAASVAFALLMDPQKAVSRAYAIDNLPMTVLVDRSGTVRYVMRDFSAKSEALYLDHLRALLDE
jgi:peroxiredoxin